MERRPSTHASVEIDATARRVWSVLANPWAYAYWVVGSDRIRSADSRWPEPGSEFRHVVGVWPLRSHDHSYVERCRPKALLQLRVKARPFLTARVWLELTEHQGRTTVAMFEDAADARSRLLLNPLSQPLVKLRNEVALRRLRRLAEGTEEIPDPAQAQSGEA